MIWSKSKVDELLPIALKVAKKRQDWNDNQGKRDNHGYEGDGLSIHQQGALAETCAASLLLGKLAWNNTRWDGHSQPTSDMYWNAYMEVSEYAAFPDIAPNIEVRSTTHINGRLLCHPTDNDDRLFILIRLPSNGTAEFVGWISGLDAKKKEYWKSLQANRPCFVIPSEKLNSMDLLLQRQIKK